MRRTIVGLFLLILCSLFQPAAAQGLVLEETHIIVEGDGWQLIGNLILPASDHALPAVLMLHKAAGDRTVYKDLAHQLAARGVASLRLDLRGHGESINLGRFDPNGRTRSPLIWDAEIDVMAAHDYLKAHARIDSDRMGMVGASYSGEEMAEAGRQHGYAQAYVALSPGSFSDESILGIDASKGSWLFIVSKNERYLREITTAVQAQSQTVEVVIVPGTAHATDILEGHPDRTEQIAVWLAQQLQE